MSKLKEAFKLGIFLVAAMMVYDINKAGGFVKSDIYNFLKDCGIVEYAEIFIAQIKTFYYKAIKFSEGGAHVYPTDICPDLETYLQLFRDLLFVFKGGVHSLLENSSHSFNKNFPTAVDDVSTLVSEALTSTKEGLFIISSHLQNITLSAVNYANEVLRT